MGGRTTLVEMRLTCSVPIRGGVGEPGVKLVSWAGTDSTRQSSQRLVIRHVTRCGTEFRIGLDNFVNSI